MKQIVIQAKDENSLTDVEYLEQIYKKVRLEELVKFRGKAYKRIVPKSTKVYKYPYHFYCVSEDIYAGSCLTEDEDGEDVCLLCHYSVVLEKKGE